MGARRAMVLALAALALVAVAALGAVAWTGAQARADVLTRAKTDVGETRTIVASHAAAMRSQAEALVAAASASGSAEHGHWIADGQLMLSYAASLDDLAAKLADRERLLGGHSTWWTEPGIGLLASAGAALRDEGRATIAHADAMAEHASGMERAEAGGLAAQDVAALRDGAARMRESGQRVVRLGDALARYGDDLARSMAMR